MDWLNIPKRRLPIEPLINRDVSKLFVESYLKFIMDKMVDRVV
jgi:hypothetical protein